MTRAERIEAAARDLIDRGNRVGSQSVLWREATAHLLSALALPPDPARYPATVEGGKLIAADLAGYRRGIEDAAKVADDYVSPAARIRALAALDAVPVEGPCPTCNRGPREPCPDHRPHGLCLACEGRGVTTFGGKHPCPRCNGTGRTP